MPKPPASEAPRPGRHHVGITGGIISEYPGDFVGIRIVSEHVRLPGLVLVLPEVGERDGLAGRVLNAKRLLKLAD